MPRCQHRLLTPFGAAVLVAGAFVSAGCDDDAGADPDAAAALDAAASAVDAGSDAGASADAGSDAGGPPGFGAITGSCGVVDLAQLDSTAPVWFQGELTFDNRYDDPAERDLLTAGGVEIILDGNAGGSSLYSEVFAFEWLARCEAATLLKTETEITYDIAGKKADLLVELHGRKVGVSVTRLVMFPFGQPYTMSAATTLLDKKLDDLQLATTQVSAADLWSQQMLVAAAYDAQHAEVAMAAWAALDAPTRGDTILIVFVTSGDDLFIYTDR